MSYQGEIIFKGAHITLLSANEVWVGHRNAGRPSVRPVRPPCGVCISAY